MSDHASSALAHQFEDLEQQHEAASFGMWIFLATEVMFFGGLFASYTIYRNLYMPGFEAGSHMLNVTIGAINTAILIGSSLTMAMAVRAAQMGKRNALMTFLIMTILLGLAFVLIKLTLEWRHDYLEGLAPGVNFTFAGAHAKSVELFFFFYFAMTGVHALHMVVGVGFSLFCSCRHGEVNMGRIDLIRLRGPGSIGISWTLSGFFSSRFCI